MLQLSPNWFHGLVSRDLWPDRPRDFFGYPVNFFNLLPVSTAPVSKSVVFSRRVEALVFGGTACVLDSTDSFFFQPSTGSWPGVLVVLANPSGNEVYTGGQGSTLQGGNIPEVPIGHIFACAEAGATAGTRDGVHGAAQPAGRVGIWPVPIRVQRGGALSIQVRNILTGGGGLNVRMMLWVALVNSLNRKAA